MAPRRKLKYYERKKRGITGCSTCKQHKKCYMWDCRSGTRAEFARLFYEHPPMQIEKGELVHPVLTMHKDFLQELGVEFKNRGKGLSAEVIFTEGKTWTFLSGSWQKTKAASAWNLLHG